MFNSDVNTNIHSNANDNANPFGKDNFKDDDNEIMTTSINAGSSSIAKEHENRSCLTNHKSNAVKVLIVIFLVAAFWLSRTILPGVQRTNITALSAPEILNSGKAYLIYGTAWKEDKTAELVSEAVRAGFRFIDTAGQPKHYNEVGVGDGWTSAAEDMSLNRDDLFLQTKFTSAGGQDPDNMPYDKDAEIAVQVQQSFASSLVNLQTEYIDSLILHSPYSRMEDTLTVWRAFESFVDDGKVHQLGISNCYDFDVFVELYDKARIKPAVLQNRFYSDSNFDVQLRDYCAQVGVTYQSFWTLTANRDALKTTRIKELSALKNLTPQTLMYAFMMTLGHTPLSGSTSTKHISEDVALVQRIQEGEVILNEAEMLEMSSILGVQESLDR